LKVTEWIGNRGFDKIPIKINIHSLYCDPKQVMHLVFIDIRAPIHTADTWNLRIGADYDPYILEPVILFKAVVDLKLFPDFRAVDLYEAVSTLPELLYPANQVLDPDNNGGLLLDLHHFPPFDGSRRVSGLFMFDRFSSRITSDLTIPSMIDSGRAAQPGT
jgi:hypothetical protein